ncbi:MAG: hypothetical protein MJ014_00090 [Methanocorpusculum sp.]|nr:hypothetical protein [Methanocorpusculum sp.]
MNRRDAIDELLDLLDTALRRRYQDLVPRPVVAAQNIPALQYKNRLYYVGGTDEDVRDV